jgi:hypothetical protein
MSSSKAIAKGRFRSSLPGRQTSALATAIRNSQKALAKDFAMANAPPPEIPPNSNSSSRETTQQAISRMRASDPRVGFEKALGLQMNPLVSIPSMQSKLVIAPGVNPGLAVAVKTKRSKKQQGNQIVMASIAPEGEVVKATEVFGLSSGNDFQATLEQYLKNKSHTKTTSVFDYVKGQYEKGLKFNGSTKRWIKR